MPEGSMAVVVEVVRGVGEEGVEGRGRLQEVCWAWLQRVGSQGDPLALVRPGPGQMLVQYVGLIPWHWLPSLRTGEGSREDERAVSVTLASRRRGSLRLLQLN